MAHHNLRYIDKNKSDERLRSRRLSVSLGIGVLFSALFVFVFQGAIVLLAGVLQPVLNDAAIAEITCASSLMIVALGFNILGITKIKVANYLPALIFVPICMLYFFSFRNLDF